MGGSLPRLPHDHGLRDISVEPFVIRLPHDVHDSLVRPALEAAVAAGELDPATCAARVDGSRRAAQSGYQADMFVGIAAAGTTPA